MKITKVDLYEVEIPQFHRLPNTCPRFMTLPSVAFKPTRV